MDPREYIDTDEGREEARPEPLTCYGCGKESAKLYSTYWTNAQVCSACVLHSDEFPEAVFSNQPTPAQVLDAIEKSPTIEAVRAAFRLIEPMQAPLFPPAPRSTYGVAAIGPGMYVRTAPRKGGRR